MPSAAACCLPRACSPPRPAAQRVGRQGEQRRSRARKPSCVCGRQQLLDEWRAREGREQCAGFGFGEASAAAHEPARQGAAASGGSIRQFMSTAEMHAQRPFLTCAHGSAWLHAIATLKMLLPSAIRHQPSLILSKRWLLAAAIEMQGANEREGVADVRYGRECAWVSGIAVVSQVGLKVWVPQVG